MPWRYSVGKFNVKAVVDWFMAPSAIYARVRYTAIFFGFRTFTQWQSLKQDQHIVAARWPKITTSKYKPMESLESANAYHAKCKMPSLCSLQTFSTLFLETWRTDAPRWSIQVLCFFKEPWLRCVSWPWVRIDSLETVANACWLECRGSLDS